MQLNNYIFFSSQIYKKIIKIKEKYKSKINRARPNLSWILDFEIDKIKATDVYIPLHVKTNNIHNIYYP